MGVYLVIIERMDMQLMKEWQQHNNKLQNHYKAFLSANNQEERDTALATIQKELSWDPFMCICCDKKIPLIHIVNRGIDQTTKECINIIDKIAKGQLSYNFE